MMNLSRFALAMSLFVGSATSNNVPAASDLADEIRAWNDNNAIVSDELSRRLSVTPAPTTADPVAAPTGSPTTPAPTGSPTTSPTAAPTGSPTPAPTGSPTISPTAAPTGSPTTAAEGSLTAPKDVTNPTQITIYTPGSFKYNGVNCTNLSDSEKASITSKTVADVKAGACAAPLDPSKCSVTSKTVCTTQARRKLVRGERRLASDTLEVLFNITVTSYCQQGDCSDVKGIIDSVEAVIKQNLDSAGTLAALPTAIQQAVPDLSSATISQTATLQKVVVPLLEDLLNWYPDWHGGTNTCRNDGEYPFYMSRHGSYFRSTLKDCCEYYYGWAFNECLGLGGGNTAELASNEFYADYDTESCVQDCPEGTAGKNCGGLVEGNWVVLYSTASECCKGKFWWIEENVCIGESTQNQTAINVANAGSGKYYVDWSVAKCVKDCAKSSTDAACGGLADKWDDLYSSASVCCSTRLSYVDRDECTR